jgi:hypothetical protein
LRKRKVSMRLMNACHRVKMLHQHRRTRNHHQHLKSIQRARKQQIIILKFESDGIYIDIEQQGMRKKQEYIILISLSLIHTNKQKKNIKFLSHTLPPLPSTSIFPPIYTTTTTTSNNMMKNSTRWSRKKWITIYYKNKNLIFFVGWCALFHPCLISHSPSITVKHEKNQLSYT